MMWPHNGESATPKLNSCVLRAMSLNGEASAFVFWPFAIPHCTLSEATHGPVLCAWLLISLLQSFLSSSPSLCFGTNLNTCAFASSNPLLKAL